MTTTGRFLPFLLAAMISCASLAQQNDPLKTMDSDKQKHWVDSVMSAMTLNQKIGQLFMIRAYSNKDKRHADEINRLVKRNHLGGVAFFQGTPQKQIELTNRYQRTSKIPLFIGIDAEWGLNMRLDHTFPYPKNMTLGAIQDNDLIEQFGKRVGWHSKRIGVQINFAPDADINTNPENPVIGVRSFGEDKHNVASKAIAFTRGMQSEGVIGTAKHFPGHGDTATDSHKTLPVLNYDRNRLESMELYPFRELIRENLTGVMIAHLDVPAFETEKGMPTSLSHQVVTGELQDKMGFNGLIMTDALDMKGASNYGPIGKIDLLAFQAGNDILLLSEDVKKASREIKKALRSGTISMERLDHSVRKILRAKYWAGLNAYKPIDVQKVIEDINAPADEALLYDLYANAVTLAKNDDTLLPVRDLEEKRWAYVKMGDADGVPFVETLKKYVNIEELTSVSESSIKDYDAVIIGYHKEAGLSKNAHKFKEDELKLLASIAEKKPTILTVFTNPYCLSDIENMDQISSVVVAYQNHEVAQRTAAQAMFGALEMKGKLPVSISDVFEAGSGLITSDLKRLRYAVPESVDMNRFKLAKIDSVTKIVIDSMMAPGGQVLVARFGNVVYHKSFGYHTYEKKQKVKLTDLYDLASVTKILGGLPMVMKAEESNKFNLETTLGEMMPFLKGSNKDTITIKEALSHVGKIKAWIPYYLETVDSVSKQPFEDLYAREKRAGFGVKIAEGLYMADHYTDTIYKRIYDVEPYEAEGYRYSGLIFYLFKKYLRDIYGEDMDVLNEKYFYGPLGARSLMFNPRNRFDKTDIAPTEVDDYYRHQTLQGYVHDMGAAMMNGVSGNAGLFGNSNDVAKMMQMYLQRGYYGGKRYLKEKTLSKFNKRYYEQDSVRRGLGFDKPSLDPEIEASSRYASKNSFGHSGFTGTFTWADPDTGLLYVFLSNRVHPSMLNNKLIDANIRPIIHNLIYEAIEE